jgi:DNA-binding transcriptional regulator LsrR (DeoR family)
MERVIGIDLAALKSAPRVVGIASGEAKVPAILASLAGKWINVLITDKRTAELLISTRL